MYPMVFHHFDEEVVSGILYFEANNPRIQGGERETAKLAEAATIRLR